VSIIDVSRLKSSNDIGQVEPFVIASFFMASPIKDGTIPGAGGAEGGGAIGAGGTEGGGAIGAGGAEGVGAEARGAIATGIELGEYIIILFRKACCLFTRFVNLSIVSPFIPYIYVPGISSGSLTSIIGIHSLFGR
jgi:hypothetical protein